MTDHYDSVLLVLRLVADRLKKLQPAQVEQLIQGKADFVFLPSGATITITGPEADEVRARLAAAGNRHEAGRYLDGLKLKKNELVSLARQLDIVVGGKDTILTIKRNIIEGTTGAREDAAAIRSGSWKN
jgi:hypothetical protein